MRRGGRRALVFAPARHQMYPRRPLVTVNPGRPGRLLEGRSRPGFFDGVLTVVLKLFQLTAARRGGVRREGRAAAGPDPADGRPTWTSASQIWRAPLHRDPDGLATSSRNAYLSACRADEPRLRCPGAGGRGALPPARARAAVAGCGQGGARGRRCGGSAAWHSTTWCWPTRTPLPRLAAPDHRGPGSAAGRRRSAGPGTDRQRG